MSNPNFQKPLHLVYRYRFFFENNKPKNLAIFLKQKIKIKGGMQATAIFQSGTLFGEWQLYNYICTLKRVF